MENRKIEELSMAELLMEAEKKSKEFHAIDLEIKNRIKDRGNNFTTEEEILIGRIISNLIPSFFVNGKNLLHNHQYRDTLIKPILHNIKPWKTSNSANGADFDISKIEFKSMLYKNKIFKITDNLSLGQIDKLHTRNKNTDKIYGMDVEMDLCLSLFGENGAEIICIFYIYSKKWKEKISEEIEKAKENLKKKSNNNTEPKRDSLTLTFQMFKNLKDFKLVYFNEKYGNIEEIFSNILSEKQTSKELKRSIEYYGK